MASLVVLNDSSETSGLAASGSELMRSVRISLTEIKSNFFDEHGDVDYGKLHGSEIFEKYLRLAASLKHINLVIRFQTTQTFTCIGE